MFQVPANSNKRLDVSQTLVEDYKVIQLLYTVYALLRHKAPICKSSLSAMMASCDVARRSSVAIVTLRLTLRLALRLALRLTLRLSAIKSSKYDFAKVTIRAFLDWVHGLAIEPMNICELLELIKFLTKWNALTMPIPRVKPTT